MTHGYSAIVLAAGHARRFGADKLLQPFAAMPLLLHAIGAACAAPVDRVIVVKRPGAALNSLCAEAAARDARIAAIDVESQALSASLRAGLEAASAARGVFVFLGDMPLVPHAIAAQLAQRLGDGFAAAPSFEGRQGHPVLLSARAARLATTLSGDAGAGALLRAHADDVVRFETEDAGVILDIDTAEDAERLSKRGPS